MERNDEILYLRKKVAELKEQSKHKDKLLRDRKYEIRELNRKLSEATEQIRIDKMLIKKAAESEKYKTTAFNIACDILQRKSGTKTNGDPLVDRGYWRQYCLQLAFREFPDGMKHKKKKM